MPRITSRAVVSGFYRAFFAACHTHISNFLLTGNFIVMFSVCGSISGTHWGTVPLRVCVCVLPTDATL